MRLLLALALAASSPASAQITALRAGALIDPASGTEKRNQIVLIENGKIKDIGPNLPIPPNATTIDLSSHTLLPGLIDAHTHLCGTVDAKWDLGDFWIMSLQRRPGFRVAQGVRHAKEMLEAGFTTVRDLGNAGEYLDADLEKAIRFSIVPGPLIIFAGRIIAPFGGQFWDTPADPKLLENPEYRFADSHDELRKAIRENIYWGAKVIKIVVDSKPYRYTTDDIRFIVNEAQRAGIPVAAHVQTQPGARSAIEARVASIEHGWFISDDDLALAKQNNVAFVTTDFTVSQLIANGMDPDAAQRTHTRYIARLKRAYNAGVNIVFGSDVMADTKAQTRGQAAIEYIDSFSEAAIPPIDILRALTSRPAALLQIHNDRGALRPSLAADIVATPLNPLQNINALKQINFVMRNGQIYRRP